MMTEDMRMWTEVPFNFLYLIAIWGLVFAMINRREVVEQKDKGAALCILLAFAFLALGDTGHVGFRVIAYAMGSFETHISLLGREVNLVALGSLATAWTFTIFYVCMVFMWKARFNKKLGLLACLLLAAAAVRSLIMLHPANQWNSLEMQEPWYTVRNVPLILMQAGVAYLIIRDARASADRTFIWIGIMIVISLMCYAPVVALVQTYPIIALLMIPKTLAYLGIAIIAFRNLYPSRAVAETLA
jgi:hypothetical protein